VRPHQGRLTGRLSAPYIARVRGYTCTSGMVGMSDGRSYGNYPVCVAVPRVIGAGADVGDGARVRAKSMVGPGSVCDGEREGREP
jgi:hypothetical protein